MKRFYTNFAIQLLNFLILLFVVNAVLYGVMKLSRDRNNPLTYYGQYRMVKAYPGWSYADVVEVVRESWAQAKPQYDPIVQLKPAAERSRFVNTNDAGFRYIKDQGPWPPSADNLNVFVFGGSTAFGMGLPDDQTIPSYIQEIANAEPRKRSVRVYNFGVPNYTSTQELLLYMSLIREGHVPAVSIFIDGLNDSTSWKSFWDNEAALKSCVNESDRASHAFMKALSKLPMFRLAAELRGSGNKNDQVTNTDGAAAPPGTSEFVLERWQKNKRFIEAVATAYKTHVLFVWQPVPLYKYDLKYHYFSGGKTDGMQKIQPTSAVYPKFDEIYRHGALGDDVLDLADIQEGRKENLYVDFVHYTAPFSKDIAARICDSMKKRGIL